MGKINVQCYRTKEDLRPLVNAEALEANIYLPARSGAEVSVGFVAADAEEKQLAVPVLGGWMLRVCIETRKPAPKLVKSMTRRKVAEWQKKRNADEVPEDIEREIQQLMKAELWAKMDGELKYYWVLLQDKLAFTFAKGGALERVNGLIRRALTTFPTSPYWEGHLFDAALKAFITGDSDTALQHGLEFIDDLTMKHAGMQVKLVNIESLQADAVRQHVNVVQRFESVGTYFTVMNDFATATPYGGLVFAELSAELQEEEEELPNARECADGILNAGRAVQMAAAIDALCKTYDDQSMWVKLP